MNLRKVAGIAALLLMFAIVLGAYGAHGLESKVSPDQLDSFKTGVLYHIIHALGLMVVALLGHQFSLSVKWVVRLQYFGILFFSGSIYLLACKDLLGIAGATPVIGPITPIGGLLLIISWGLLAILLLKKQE